MTRPSRRATTRRPVRFNPTEPLLGSSLSDGVGRVVASAGPFWWAPACRVCPRCCSGRRRGAPGWSPGSRPGGRRRCCRRVRLCEPRGRSAALRIIPRRLHVYLDLVLAAGFAASPLLYLHDLQIIPIVLSEAIAVLLVRMSLTTEIVPRPRASRQPAPAGAANASSSAGSSDAVSAVAATAGRVVGTAVAKARGSDAPRVAARSLGRATGQARRLGACRSRDEGDTGLVSACSHASRVVRAV